MAILYVGIDLAKNVFGVHGGDASLLGRAPLGTPVRRTRPQRAPDRAQERSTRSAPSSGLPDGVDARQARASSGPTAATA